MSNQLKKAFKMMAAARPASGFRPETPEEWDKLQKAQVAAGCALFIKGGATPEIARNLANEIYGGDVGRIILDISFRETPNE